MNAAISVLLVAGLAGCIQVDEKGPLEFRIVSFTPVGLREATVLIEASNPSNHTIEAIWVSVQTWIQGSIEPRSPGVHGRPSPIPFMVNHRGLDEGYDMDPGPLGPGQVRSQFVRFLYEEDEELPTPATFFSVNGRIEYWVTEESGQTVRYHWARSRCFDLEGNATRAPGGPCSKAVEYFFFPPEVEPVPVFNVTRNGWGPE